MSNVYPFRQRETHIGDPCSSWFSDPRKTQVQVTESLWHAGYFLASNKVGSMGYEVIRHLMGNYQPCQRNLARTEVIERSYSACLGAGQKRQGDKDSIVDSH